MSAHGGLLALGATVQKGQVILVENRSTKEEQEFRVVYVKGPQDGKWRVGIEFAHVPVDFWKIYFPPLDARGDSLLRRKESLSIRPRQNAQLGPKS